MFVVHNASSIFFGIFCLSVRSSVIKPIKSCPFEKKCFYLDIIFDLSHQNESSDTKAINGGDVVDFEIMM